MLGFTQGFMTLIYPTLRDLGNLTKGVAMNWTSEPDLSGTILGNVPDWLFGEQVI